MHLEVVNWAINKRQVTYIQEFKQEIKVCNVRNRQSLQEGSHQF